MASKSTDSKEQLIQFAKDFRALLQSDPQNPSKAARRWANFSSGKCTACTVSEACPACTIAKKNAKSRRQVFTFF
ncbi:hypothetical protein BVRB_038620 [Beta vulgaris subsp. vulgaris]|uniref:Uncharacterized protein n=1 Tax=Beta vulgaris subsp. vulgaris TaxID=3555 RepID=A0A0J7YPU0_BETVV|nr:hypothetical protein BVRB_038620 [Beta vulgaris subsp. vulgaris]